MEIGVLGQHAQFLVEHLEALLGNVVGHDVIDGDLQVLEPGAVEALDALGGEQVPIGDQAGDHAVAANARQDGVQVRVQQRLAAADGDDGGPKIGQAVQPLTHHLQRHRLGMVVVFVAVGARQIAAAHGNDVRHDGMVRGGQPLGDHPNLTDAPVQAAPGSPQMLD